MHCLKKNGSEEVLNDETSEVVGRPKLLRKRESGEKLKAAKYGSVICVKCKQAGYNKRTCKCVDTSRSNKGCIWCLIFSASTRWCLIFTASTMRCLIFSASST
ncbi:hypothetical protein Dsin_009463 [Dipteronia sinensis]|uniref:Uncharacterized protein n=1 Tax=Dipteronia sinensis TaxID=43782 RepID=A0AAE0AQZ8_9ROSI|nr:hypothetical protein Dsin_009463 [Dipteronia sinensis]